MTTICAAEREPPAARPYGLIGLVVSCILIFVLALVLCVLCSLLAMVAVGAALGWHALLERMNALGVALQSNKSVLLRANAVVGIVLYAALSIAVLVAARVRGGRQWRDLVAWRAWHPFRASWLFWLVAFGSIFYSLGAGALISRWYPPSKEWVAMPSGPVWVGLFVVLAVAMAPLTEELVFRGWLYTSLRYSLAPRVADRSVMQEAASVFDEDAADARRPDAPAAGLRSVGVWVAILLTASLFALAHWENSHIYAAAVFPVGVALGFFRERTKSLLATMTFHAVYNGGALIALAFGW